MTEIDFTVPIQPIGKGRPRFSTISGHPVAYTPARTKEAEKVFRLYARRAMGNQYPFDRKIPLRVSVKAFFEVPKSYSKERRERCLSGQEFPTKKPDADNIEKFVLDGMNETIFWDDVQVIDLHITKAYTPDHGRIEVHCEVLDD